jgi:hypothetical protein
MRPRAIRRSAARSVSQAIRQHDGKPLTPPFFACFKTDILAGKSKRSKKGTWRHNLTTTTAVGYTNAYDWLAKAMGAGPSTAFASASGNATSTTANTLVNSGATFPTSGQGLAGCLVFAGPNNAGAGTRAYGVILSNSTTTLTIDQWYDPTSTSGGSIATPNGTANYIIAVGQNPAAWMAVSATVFSPSTSDTYLQGELTTNGFSRAVGSWAHTAAASTYTLVHLWTATGTETIENEAQFGSSFVSSTGPGYGGVMPFESPEPNPPTLVSGDTLQNTVTITI